MKRNQVFVRAKNKEGNWDAVDVLDLDEFSFKAFVIEMLYRAGIVVGIKDEAVEGNPIEYQEQVDNSNPEK